MAIITSNNGAQIGNPNPNHCLKCDTAIPGRGKYKYYCPECHVVEGLLLDHYFIGAHTTICKCGADLRKQSGTVLDKHARTAVANDWVAAGSIPAGSVDLAVQLIAKPMSVEQIHAACSDAFNV